MTTKIIQRRGKNIMRDITIKICLIGLVFFLSKATVLAQDQDIDIKCEVSGLDLNLSGKPGYLIEFGSFSLSEKDEKGGITKFYKLPRTKLILSVFIVHAPKDGTSENKLIAMQMILGKKKVFLHLDLDDEKITKDTISITNTIYPITIFDKGGEGTLSTVFLGKKKPVAIMMTCKKVKKEGK